MTDSLNLILMIGVKIFSPLTPEVKHERPIAVTGKERVNIAA